MKHKTRSKFALLGKISNFCAAFTKKSEFRKMSNIALKLAYDGSEFWGWQKTKLGPTIEGNLQAVLGQILQTPLDLQAASRTDRGVHAEGQWVNFFISSAICLEKLKKALNALLPPTIRVLSAHIVPDHFHPTLHAELKEYHYRICLGPTQLPHMRHFSWHVPYQLDCEKMQEAASYLLGEHDFSSFCNFRKNLNYKDKRRHLKSIEFFPDGGRLLIAVKGKSFLYKMVRNIVGSLVYVGRGKLQPDSMKLILQSGKREEAGVTAVAHGLTLKRIYYPQEFNLEI